MAEWNEWAVQRCGVHGVFGGHVGVGVCVYGGQGGEEGGGGGYCEGGGGGEGEGEMMDTGWLYWVIKGGRRIGQRSMIGIGISSTAGGHRYTEIEIGEIQRETSKSTGFTGSTKDTKVGEPRARGVHREYIVSIHRKTGSAPRHQCINKQKYGEYTMISTHWYIDISELLQSIHHDTAYFDCN